MRIAIVGTGAIGGLLAAQFVRAGEEVTLIDRGERLAALERGAFTLVEPDGTEVRIEGYAATGDVEQAGPHDLVVLAVKAHEIEAVAPRVPALFGPDTPLLTIQNGIPWWYFAGEGGAFDGRRLESLDPRGTIAEHLDPARIVGAVAYPAAVVERPGVVRWVEGRAFPAGEPSGEATPRLERIVDLLGHAGFKTRALDDVRAEVWLKAWGNLSFNPISALARATMEDIAREPATRALAARLMEEAKAVCDRLGVTVRHTIAKRIEGAERVGPHKTSMLQDVEAGRPLEHEALIGAVIEVARWCGIATPHLDTIAACVRLLDAGARA